MVADCYRVLNVTLSIFELEQDDASQLDVSGRREVEREEEGHFVSRAAHHPVLLVFSVRDLTAGHFLVALHLQKGLADRCSQKVALKLGDFGGNLFNSRGPLGSHFVVTGANSSLLLLRHTLFDFLSLGEVASADGQGHI